MSTARRFRAVATAGALTLKLMTHMLDIERSLSAVCSYWYLYLQPLHSTVSSRQIIPYPRYTASVRPTHKDREHLRREERKCDLVAVRGAVRTADPLVVVVKLRSSFG
jgi:hypothetical protein